MKNLKDFKTIFHFIKEYKMRIIFCTIVIFIGSLSEILVGYLNGLAIESITKMNLKLAILALVLYFFSEIFFRILGRISNKVLSKVQIAVARKINYLAFQKTLNLPAYAFEQITSGELINRITNDTETIVNSFEDLIRLASMIFSAFIILIFVFFQAYLVAIEIIIFIVIYAFVVRKFNPQLKKVHKEKKMLNDEGITLVNESIRGIREIKTLGIKNSLSKNLQHLIRKMTHKSYEEIDLYFIYDAISIFLKITLEVATFITCAILLYYGKTTLTFFVAFTYYIYRFTWIIENVNSFTRIYNQTHTSIMRINEIVENKLYDDVAFGNVHLKNCAGVIEFKNVTFNYPNESDTLKNFNAQFLPHKKIGIVGKSGQGKSTIFNLLTRVFDTKEGIITIDGIDIKDLDEKSLRKYIAIIRQEPFLFNKTIKENFKILNEQLSLQDIRKYCKMAYIDEYIMSLPQGYNTVLGEGGVNLSGGQKQRLSIARALAKESQIILFDEATSALDNESQMYIKKVIDDLVKSHTIIIIAHRLSTIIDADEIFVIDDGQVKDIGTHEELISKSKIYQTLYKSELE